MRLAVVAISATLLAAGACHGATSPTRLAITVYPAGIGDLPVHHYFLRCEPAAGDVPNPVRACRVLAELRNPFAPVSPGTNCSEIALGPQEALVTGRVRGRSVRAHLTVRNSCEINRWRRVAAVVPGFPGR